MKTYPSEKHLLGYLSDDPGCEIGQGNKKWNGSVILFMFFGANFDTKNKKKKKKEEANAIAKVYTMNGFQAKQTQIIKLNFQDFLWQIL